MTVSEFTPGPWELAPDLTGKDVLSAVTSLSGDIGYFTLRPTQQRRANARLIAAAPELLGALVAVRARFQELRLGPDESAVLDRVHAVIAKATGA